MLGDWRHKRCFAGLRAAALAILLLPVCAGASGAEAPAPPFPEDLSHYVVAYDGTHQAIEVVGPFGRGIAEAFRREFDKHPDVKSVHLTSPGGLVIEGRQLRDLIYARKLNTYVRTACISACTLAFIGGDRRTMRRGAVIGFHQYSRSPYEKYRLRAQDQDRSYFAGRGVSRRFLDRMFDADSSSVLTLSADEAVKEKLATQATDRFEAPPVDALPAASQETIRAVLARVDRLANALRDYEPEKHYQLVITIYDATMSGWSAEDAVQLGEPIWFSLIDQLLPTTSDAAAQSMAAAFATVYGELRKVGPKACVDSMLGLPSGGGEWDRLSAATLRKLVEATADVVQDAHQRPQPRPSKQDRERLDAELRDMLLHSIDSDDVDFMRDSGRIKEDPERACRLLSTYMKALAMMPDGRGGALLRIMEAEEE